MGDRATGMEIERETTFFLFVFKEKRTGNKNKIVKKETEAVLLPSFFHKLCF